MNIFELPRPGFLRRCRLRRRFSLHHWRLARTPSAIFIAVSLASLLVGCHSEVDPTVLHPEVAVVKIVTLSEDPGQIEVGRGFFVSPDGLIVTRMHLVHTKGEVLVTPPGRKEMKAQFVQEDKDSDLAIIKVQGEHFPYLRLFDDDIIPPMHVRLVGSDGITQGVFEHWQNLLRDMAFTARISLADSGAPLLADDGRVVGVVRGAPQNQTAENDATPIWHVLHMMPSLAPSHALPH